MSFSSRIIAAWRALETEGEGALFCDPLAEALAGNRAMQRARQRVKVSAIIMSSVAHLSTPCIVTMQRFLAR